jgi:hypothetical protein
MDAAAEKILLGQSTRRAEIAQRRLVERGPSRPRRNRRDGGHGQGLQQGSAFHGG